MELVKTNLQLDTHKANKLLKFLDCIDTIEEKEDGMYIKYNKNIIEVYPENKLTVTQGLDIKIAKTIHFNPDIVIDKTFDATEVINKTNQSVLFKPKYNDLLFKNKETLTQLKKK